VRVVSVRYLRPAVEVLAGSAVATASAHPEVPAGSRAFEYYTEPHPGPDHYEVPADEQVSVTAVITDNQGKEDFTTQIAPAA